jgi:hypothetical protein
VVVGGCLRLLISRDGSTEGGDLSEPERTSLGEKQLRCSAGGLRPVPAALIPGSAYIRSQMPPRPMTIDCR